MNDQTEPRPVESEHAIAGKIVAGMKRFVDSRTTMSSDTETLADILAYYRADLPKMTSGELYHPTPEYVRILLDRIEAAAERERKANQTFLATANEAIALLKDERNRAVQYANAAPHPGSASWKEMQDAFLAAKIKSAENPGNSAALREALERSTRRLEAVATALNCGEMEKYINADIRDNRAALAAPARNCDRFKTEEEAQKAWAEYNHNNGPFEHWATAAIDWLFAPAEEVTK